MPAPQVAAMFHMNIQSWKHQNFVKRNYPDEQIASLEARLRDAREQNATAESVTWGLRQIMYTTRSAGADHPTP